MINATMLTRLGCPAASATIYAPALCMALDAGKINTGLRVAHFLAQAAHETGGFARLDENLNYRDPVKLDSLFKNVRGVDHARALIAQGREAIANCAYGGRGGNGNEASGDGWKYRGRGFLQITLRGNYERFFDATGVDVISDPDILLRPVDAARAAALYWEASDCNRYADSDDVAGVTRCINGAALEGLEDRRTRLKAVKKLMGL